jgi:hypothetical protein
MHDIVTRGGAILGNVLSGHTFKHFAAATACYAILRYFQTRRQVA